VRYNIKAMTKVSTKTVQKYWTYSQKTNLIRKKSIQQKIALELTIVKALIAIG